MTSKLSDNKLLDKLDNIVDECIKRSVDFDIIVQTEIFEKEDAVIAIIASTISNSKAAKKISLDAYGDREMSEDSWQSSFNRYIELLMLQHLGRVKTIGGFIEDSLNKSQLKKLKALIAAINMDDYKFSPTNKTLIKLLKKNGNNYRYLKVQTLFVSLGYGVVLIGYDKKKKVGEKEFAVVVDEAVYRKGGGKGELFFPE